MWGLAHARAFSVAKATQLDVLADLRAAVDKAIAEGTTLHQFRKELKPTLQSKGWWGEKEVVDPKTGEKVLAQLGSAARLRTIYETNLRQAQSAGRYERMQRTKERRPYARYVCVDDGNTRAEHWAWHELILPVDDPWWDTHWPPNGWGCRCKVMQLSDRDLARYGFKVGVAPPIKLVTYRNERTGAVTRVPAGIDPSFDYNPGKAPRFDPSTYNAKEIPLENLQTWKSYGRPDAKTSRSAQPPAPAIWHEEKGPADRARTDAAFMQLFGLESKDDTSVVSDPLGDGVEFNFRWLEHLRGDHKPSGEAPDRKRTTNIPLAKQAIESPYEIWLVPFRRPDGSVVMRKRYIGLWSDREQLMVASKGDDGYIAWTTTAARNVDRQREGYLLYPRQK